MSPDKKDQSVIEYKIEQLNDQMKKLREEIKEAYVTRGEMKVLEYRINQIQKIVYGVSGAVLFSFVNSLIDIV